LAQKTASPPAKNCLASVGVSVDESDPIHTLGGQGDGAVSADSEPAVTQAPYQIRMLRQTVGPLTDP
jgi:hypothetical protein